MKYAWLPLVIAVVACRAAPRPDDSASLYRAGRMHELRDRLRTERAASADAATRNAILLARVCIDLRVVWDDGSFADALAALASARPTEPRLVAEVEQATGEALFWQRLVTSDGSWDEIRGRFERALELRTSVRDTRGVAETTFYRGLIAQLTGDAAEARRWFERAVELGRDVDDPLLRSYPVRHLAALAEDAGELARAATLHREALALREQAGDVLRLFNARVTLATFLCERMRDCAAAQPHIEAARRTADALRMPHGAIEIAILDAQLAEWRGDARARDAAWQRTLALAAAIDDEPTSAAVRAARAAARLRARDITGALADARAAGSAEGHAIVVEASLIAGDTAAADAALAAAWTDAPAAPSARLYLAAAAWLASQGSRGAAIAAITARAGLPPEPRRWRDAALAAARRDHDRRAEIDALVSVGDREHLDAARGISVSAHLPLQLPPE